MSSDVSQILNAIEAGDPAAASRLFPLVYDELRRMAAGKMAQEAPGQSLQATAPVHEAYLWLVERPNRQRFINRSRFLASRLRRCAASWSNGHRCAESYKRGGGRKCLDLDEQDITAPEQPDDLLALDAALDRLSAAEPQAAELVKLRYFAERTMTEAAELLGLSRRSAHRLWAYARAWLLEELSNS